MAKFKNRKDLIGILMDTEAIIDINYNWMDEYFVNYDCHELHSPCYECSECGELNDYIYSSITNAFGEESRVCITGCVAWSRKEKIDSLLKLS